jgi:hypothetical protein
MRHFATVRGYSGTSQACSRIIAGNLSGVDLVPTGDAAKAIGVNKRTLERWVQRGLVKPTILTPGGHGRWDVDDLKAQLREKRERDE